MKTKLLKNIGLCLLFFVMAIPLTAQESGDCESSKFEIKEIEAIKSLVIKAEVTMEEIGDAMGKNYGELFTYTGSNNIQPAGPSFAVYLSWDPEGKVVFESGVPVAQKESCNDNIVYKEFPAMKVVATLYKGAYEKMEPVYHEMMEYMKANKLESTNESWEIYLTDPNEVAPEENQTMIYFRIK